ncbi:MAG: amidohydrolase family protein [Luteitalea sp.]|nr:amidohydrolase family protein [Luteitalea sp.]
MPEASTLVLRGGTLVLPDRLLDDAAVLCRNGRIVATGSFPLPDDAEIIDAGGGFIAPGFVDQHVHGALGADFMDGTPQAVELAIRGHTHHGTTSILPTTTTGTRQQIVAMLDACENVRRDWHPGKHARVAGVHFYGPYFASDKVGAHPHGYERDPDPDEYLPALERGIIRVATCAAELPGAEAFYREASRRGCLCTCGHSNASWTEMQRAYNAGLRHVDHFWCAMSTTTSIRERLGVPMQASMAEFVVATPGMSTEVIADGQHLGPDLLEYTYGMLGPDRLILITDSNRAVDMPEGEYMLGPHDTGEPFISDGTVGRCLAGGLASTVCGMDHMVRTMVRDTAAGLVQAIRMASLTPARLIGIQSEVGSLEPGKLADIQVLDRQLYTQRVFIEGVEFRGC